MIGQTQSLQEQVREMIRRQTEIIEPLEHEIALAHWDANLSGEPRDFEKTAALEKRMVEHFSDPRAYAEIRALFERKDEIEDPLDARQIDVLHRSFRGCQGDPELQKRIVDLESDLTRVFNTFRAEYRGEQKSDNDLRELMKRTNDSTEAREAWEALKQVGALAAPRVVELVRLRNQHAQSLGSPNFYAFSLELQELDQDRLFELLDQLEKESDPLFREFKNRLDDQLAGEFGIAAAELRPWHYRNPFFQEAPSDAGVDLDPVFSNKDLAALTREYYRGVGLDIEPILRVSDLYEKPGKNQHAFCIAIDAPEDVRVLCNIRSNENWMSTMLHEFGHAVYDRYLDPALPRFLRGPAHTLTTEAVAMLNERFLRQADFLEGIAGMDPDSARRAEADSRSHKRDSMLVFLRWVLVMARFERALYESPEQDLCALWWDMVARHQWLDGSSRRAHPDWASKLHLAGAPVYYQNYLLGEMTASQLLAALRRETDGSIIGNPKVGQFFRERVFAPGAGLPWNARLREATGEELNPRYYIEDLRVREASPS